MTWVVEKMTQIVVSECDIDTHRHVDINVQHMFNHVPPLLGMIEPTYMPNSLSSLVSRINHPPSLTQLLLQLIPPPGRLRDEKRRAGRLVAPFE